MTNCVYLAWQEQNTRRWHIIGQLLRTEEGYEFRYTQGVNDISSLSLSLSMPEHDKVYRSEELFALFQNRLMPKSRPEYLDYLNWMDLSSNSMNEMDALAISSGERMTDFFRIIPVPEKKEDDFFSFRFFVNGLSHLDNNAKERVRTLKNGDFLYILHDFQNKHDNLALSLRTDEPACLVGYIPAYFAKVIHKIREKGEDKIQVKVLKVNETAPIQMRLLCEMSLFSFKGSWDAYEDEFKLISNF